MKTIIPKHRTRARIEAARRLLKPSPVDYHKLPAWLRKRLQQARREGRIGLPRGIASNSGAALVDAAMPGSTLDHWGRLLWRDKPAFVVEPYRYLQQHIDDFLEVIGPGVEYEISANAWHFPGRAFRIVFWERGSEQPAESE
ncbi:MAG: hypothetical protein ABGZ35_12175 [Planctomycetaceae bacterium]